MTNESRLTIGIYGIQDITNSGIPTISHDHGICVMQKGKILFNLQLERLNRKKHSDAMPQLLYNLLKEKKLLTKACDFVFVDNILGRSFINDIGNIRFEAPLQKKLQEKIEDGRLWLLDNMESAYALNHELAHIGSCLPFFGTFKENSLLIHFDGGASQSNFSTWHFKNGELKNLQYDWRLKKLSSLFNANALTFSMVKAKPHDLNSVPGKFMGFASFGKYNSTIENWLVEHKFFENIWGSKKFFFEAVNSKFGVELNEFDQKNQLIQDIAATIHHIFVRDTLKEIETLQKQTNTEYLYYSGGSALNIVLNTKIIESKIFKDVFITPCCNDSGLAIGAASFFEWEKHGSITKTNPFLNNWSIEQYKTKYSINTIKEVSDLLIDGKVIGVCNGFGEIGPRALGNRSIISLASSKKLAKKVSMAHKKREWYRPVAPIMLEKNSKYFTGCDKIHHLSKYMLLDFNILNSKIEELEGAVHIDDTARIQTIFNRSDNPFMYDLLEFIDKKHDIKALINTSFNVRGEPIVHTIEDARKSAENMKLDAVVLNGELKILS
jgi:carbamoyltransferase